MITTAIGIQARLASERMPKKTIYQIDNETIVAHLLNRLRNSILWMEKKPNRNHLRFNIYLLVPNSEFDYWSQFVDLYNIKHYSEIRILPGDMNNVFSRYNRMFDESRPDYFVRLTADCPFIPAPCISKAINIAHKDDVDYVTNTIEDVRTMPDGYDIEVLSSRAFSWLIDAIDYDSYYHLEHVTTYLKENYPDWMNIACLSTNLDQSHLKYSIDEKHEYDAIKCFYLSKKAKDRLASKKGFAVYEY